MVDQSHGSPSKIVLERLQRLCDPDSLKEIFPAHSTVHFTFTAEIHSQPSVIICVDPSKELDHQTVIDNNGGIALFKTHKSRRMIFCLMKINAFMIANTCCIIDHCVGNSFKNQLTQRHILSFSRSRIAVKRIH